MPEPENVRAIVREWVEKAENDLKTAAHTLKLGSNGPTDTVCFHAQQCVEKYLKALLVFKGIDFPKTHDIGELTALATDLVRLEIPVAEQRRLTAYATITRYPGDYDPITLSEARRAVALARKVRKAIRVYLPKEATEGE